MIEYVKIFLESFTMGPGGPIVSTDAEFLEESFRLEEGCNLQITRLAEDSLPTNSCNMPLTSSSQPVFDPELAVNRVSYILVKRIADLSDLVTILRFGIRRGNITQEHLETIDPVWRDKLKVSMKKFKVKVQKGRTMPFNKLNVARLMSLFPGIVLFLIGKLDLESSVSRVLSQSVKDKVPARLRFLNVAALSIVLENDEDKQKLLRLATLVLNDYLKNVAKLTGRIPRVDINKTLQSQQHLGPNMSAFVKYFCEEKDLISALAESNL